MRSRNHDIIPTANPIPVVTYSRISPDPGAAPRAARAPEVDRSEPRFSAAAPPVDPFDLGHAVENVDDATDDFDRHRYADELIVDVDAEAFERKGRSWSARAAIVVGVIAIAAGIGVLAGSLGTGLVGVSDTATIGDESRAGGSLAALDVGASDAAARSIRMVGPVTADAPAQAVPAAEPPLPRTRPERQVAVLSADAGAPADRPATPQVASAAPAASQNQQAAGGESDPLIAMIERALAASQAVPPPAAEPAPLAAEPAPTVTAEPIRGPGILAAPSAVMVPTPPIPDGPTPLADVPTARLQ